MTDTPPPAAALAAKCKAWQDVANSASEGPFEVWDRNRPVRPYIVAMTVDAQRYPGPVEGVTVMMGKAGGGSLYWPAVGDGGIPRAEAAANAKLFALSRTALPLAARAMAVLVATLTELRGCADNAETGCTWCLNEIDEALRRAAAIVEEVSDGQEA